MRAVRRLRSLALAGVLLASCSPTPSSAPPTAPASPAGGSASPSALAPASAVPASAAPGSACTAAAAVATHDWNNRVWYEIFVRSFADGNGDGIGDFKGLTAKLDYLNDGDPATTSDLGITGIWLMPIFESPSYHGYDVTDYRKIEAAYGSSADFAAFLAAAHKRGIAVILDLTLNHTSDQNPWFAASAKGDAKYAEWYIWSKTDPGYFGPEGQLVWHQDGNRWYYGIFSPQMPDLNLTNPAVTAEMDAMAKHWLVDVGVDGFRLDAAKYLIEQGQTQMNTQATLDWLASFHQLTQAAAPNSMLVGEVWDTPQVAGKYVPRSMDLTFNFGLESGTISALQNQRVAPLVTGLTDTQTAWPPLQSGVFLANHDQNRVMSQLAGQVAAAREAATILFAEPGVPFLYYGEEIGMQGQKPDPEIRRPMQWSADKNGGFTTGVPWESLGSDWSVVNVAAQTSDPSSLLSLYRSLIRLHGEQSALRDGQAAIVDGGADSVIGILRSDAKQNLLLVANVSDKPVSEYGLKLAKGPLCGQLSAKTLIATGLGSADAPTAPIVTPAGGFAAWKPFASLPPRSAAILALDPTP